MLVCKPEVAFEFDRELNEEQWQAVRRIQTQISQSPEFWPFLERVEINFNSHLATTRVVFNRECWDSDPVYDCGSMQQAVSFGDICFDVSKWRKYFRDQMKAAIVRRFAEAATPLASASFMADDEKIDAIRLALIAVEQRCEVLFRV
ncbi:MAG: hypothetical protein AAB880_00225 [Patescibacteria group bacterium]